MALFSRNIRTGLQFMISYSGVSLPRWPGFDILGWEPVTIILGRTEMRAGTGVDRCDTKGTVPSFWEGGARLYIPVLSAWPQLSQSGWEGAMWGQRKKPVCLGSPASLNWLWIMDLICHLMSLDINFISLVKRRLGKMIFEFPLSPNALCL